MTHPALREGHVAVVTGAASGIAKPGNLAAFSNAVAEHFGTADFLMNNAAVQVHGPEADGLDSGISSEASCRASAPSSRP